jgi:hypothetical protein
MHSVFRVRVRAIHSSTRTAAGAWRRNEDAERKRPQQAALLLKSALVPRRFPEREYGCASWRGLGRRWRGDGGAVGRFLRFAIISIVVVVIVIIINILIIITGCGKGSVDVARKDRTCVGRILPRERWECAVRRGRIRAVAVRVNRHEAAAAAGGGCVGRCLG